MCQIIYGSVIHIESDICAQSKTKLNILVNIYQSCRPSKKILKWVILVVDVSKAVEALRINTMLS